MPSAGPKPLISIALCTYNGALYLREQLDSLLAQREVGIEIVAVDDGSHDQSRGILHDYATADPRFRCFANDRNLGPTASFEYAMSLCRGDFIAPCDQDDIWHPDKLARLLAVIGACDLAYCDSALVDERGRTLHRRVSGTRTMLSGTAPGRFLFANSVSGHASLLRRALFEHARPFPDGVYHDWWLALCAAGGNGIRYLDEPLVLFRRHQDAHSSIGKPGRAAGLTTASDAWLEQQHALICAYGSTTFRDSDIALALAGAMRRAIDGAGSGPLMRLLWRQRRVLTGHAGIPVVAVAKLQWKLLRKLRRIRRGPGGNVAGTR